MYVASDSHSDLPVFPLLERASRHDMLSFLHSFSPWKHTFRSSVLKNSFWIPPMTLMLSMSTADRKISLPLSTLIPDIPDISLIRTISPLMRTASRSVRWAYVCIKTDMRLLSTGRNTVVQNQIGHVAASVSIPVHLQNTEEPYTFFTADNPRLFNIPPRDSKSMEKGIWWKYFRRTLQQAWERGL